jgi:hypothetical protein
MDEARMQDIIRRGSTTVREIGMVPLEEKPIGPLSNDEFIKIMLAEAERRGLLKNI